MTWREAHAGGAPWRIPAASPEWGRVGHASVLALHTNGTYDAIHVAFPTSNVMQDLSRLPFVEVSSRGARLHRAQLEGGGTVLVAGRGATAAGTLAWLHREYALRGCLHEGWAVMPRQLLPHQDGTVLVLDDPGGETLGQSMAGARSMERFLEVALRLTGAVAAMHAAGVVHRALSPHNILWSDTTGDLRLTGFGAAVRSGQSDGPQDEALVWDDACFDYMAPELGARMNTPVDGRADLYALGCIFHELLVGEPPFGESGPAGPVGTAQEAASQTRIHAHATRLPQPLHLRSPQVPAQLSAVVLRLLAKSADQRYSDATSLLADLRSCETLWRRHGAIPAFALDAHGRVAGWQSHHLVLGRELELQQLLSLYEEVRAGQGLRVAWVSGSPGIGKSSLLSEAVGRMPGAPMVATGKCATGPHAMPFQALYRALEPMLQYVLGSPEGEFEAWHDRLLRATQPVSLTVAGFLPGLAALLRLPAETVSPALTDAALVFERETVLRAMARLIASFARPERPLVLLLDDLQWADADTRRVLERLMLDHAHAPLLLLGSLRTAQSDEAAPASILAMHADGRRAVAAMPGADDDPTSDHALFGAPGAVQLRLAPLDVAATQALVADALQQDARTLGPLTDAIERWTGRNPFFIRRLLARMVGEKLLRFDAAQGSWTWDNEHLQEAPARQDLDALLARDLLDMPAQTQALLRILACLGDRASEAVLAQASGGDRESLPARMAPALAAGFVRYHDSLWMYAHDRLREAVLGAAAPLERATLHLEIARRQRVAGEGSLTVFGAASQAQMARAAVTAQADRRAFGHLNLEAGRRAKAATAHHTALGFFRGAVDFFSDLALAGEEGATSPAPELLEATLLCGEAEFMTGALAAAEARLSALQRQAGQGVFGAELARLRAALYTTLGQFDRALDVGLAFLAEVGFPLSRHPKPDEVHEAYADVMAWLTRHGFDALRQLPSDTDALRQACMDIFADLLPPALYTDQLLVDLMQLRMVQLAIRHGHTDASANCYVCMIQVVGMRYGDYAMAHAFGELALHLVDARGLRRYEARVHHTWATFVVPWTRPARTARSHFEHALEVATRTGDHTFAVYCGRNQATGMWFSGEFLEDVRETVARGLTRARDADFQLVVNALLAQQGLLRQLQDGHDAQDTMAEPLVGAPVTLVDLAYWVYRLQAALLFGDLPAALRAHRRAQACHMAARCFAEFAELPFYGALALLQLPERDKEDEAALQRHVRDLTGWAAGCPENFSARLALVRAEQARAEGRRGDAAACFADAVALARQHGFTQVEALAAERAGSFHASLGRDIESRAYLRHALAAWQRWGAAAKARHLQQQHADALDMSLPASPSTSSHQQLDVQAVLRITHALASEIVPDRLVETLMRTALEATGAEHGALVLLRDDHWTVRARAHALKGAMTVDHGSCALSQEVLPVAAVQAVARTQQSIHHDDARDAPALAQEDYVRRVRPRSMLCVPVLRYSRLIGVIHLENNLAPRVFTAAKAALLEVMASQAAFALENTRLYAEVLEQGHQRAQAEERLRGAMDELARASRLKAMGELVASIVHEIGQPLSAIDTSARAADRWLNRREPDIGEALAMVAHVSLSARRAKSIIQGLRAMARKAEPLLVELDLGEALRECASLVGAAIAEREVALSLVEPDEDCRIRGDRVQLQQVVINLLMNGAEAMVGVPAPGRHLALSWARSEDKVRVTVEDRGPGIAPEALKRLLEPFFTTKADGMGMGLAICKSIVDAHGGTLSFGPREGGGTRAELLMPGALATPKASEGLGSAPPAQVPSATSAQATHP